jgi:Tetratrico peptide repeat
MPKTKVRPYPRLLLEQMEQTSGYIMKARALVAMGMQELAVSAWLAAAAGEEQVAPRLETLERDQEAAVHRISAASCYQHAGELAKAVNLYRAALAGPLPEPSRKETEHVLASCLVQLARSANGSAAT